MYKRHICVPLHNTALCNFNMFKILALIRKPVQTSTLAFMYFRVNILSEISYLFFLVTNHFICYDFKLW